METKYARGGSSRGTWQWKSWGGDSGHSGRLKGRRKKGRWNAFSPPRQQAVLLTKESYISGGKNIFGINFMRPVQSLIMK